MSDNDMDILRDCVTAAQIYIRELREALDKRDAEIERLQKVLDDTTAERDKYAVLLYKYQCEFGIQFDEEPACGGTRR